MELKYFLASSIFVIIAIQLASCSTKDEEYKQMKKEVDGLLKEIVSQEKSKQHSTGSLFFHSQWTNNFLCQN